MCEQQKEEGQVFFLLAAAEITAAASYIRMQVFLDWWRENKEPNQHKKLGDEKEDGRFILVSRKNKQQIVGGPKW